MRSGLDTVKDSGSTEGGLGRCVTIPRERCLWNWADGDVHESHNWTKYHLFTRHTITKPQRCKLWWLAGRLTHIIYGAVEQKLGLCVALLQNPEGDTFMWRSNLVLGLWVRIKDWGGELLSGWTLIKLDPNATGSEILQTLFFVVCLSKMGFKGECTTLHCQILVLMF